MTFLQNAVVTTIFFVSLKGKAIFHIFGPFFTFLVTDIFTIISMKSLVSEAIIYFALLVA